MKVATLLVLVAGFSILKAQNPNKSLRDAAQNLPKFTNKVVSTLPEAELFSKYGYAMKAGKDITKEMLAGYHLAIGFYIHMQGRWMQYRRFWTNQSGQNFGTYYIGDVQTDGAFQDSFGVSVDSVTTPQMQQFVDRHASWIIRDTVPPSFKNVAVGVESVSTRTDDGRWIILSIAVFKYE